MKHTVLLASEPPMLAPTIGLLIFLFSIIMLIVGLFKPAKALFWYKGERTRKRAAFTYLWLTIAGLFIFVVPFAMADDSTNASTKQNTPIIDPPVTKIVRLDNVKQLDTVSYLKAVGALSAKQVDSLIRLQFDKDSNHVVFSKIYKAEISKNKITPTSIFDDGTIKGEQHKFFYWKNLIRVSYSGSYERHNDQNITFPQIFSINAVYDLFGNLVSLEKTGLQDASIPLSTEDSRNQMKARGDSVRAAFSQWDGSHIKLTDYIREHMNDPESFEFVEARYFDRGDYIEVREKFRGKNAYNATVLNTVVARCTIDGDVLELTSQ